MVQHTGKSTYNSFPSSADTGRDPPLLLDSEAGDSCLPVAERAGLTEDGDEPRLEFNDCAVSGLLDVKLEGGVACKHNIDINTGQSSKNFKMR